MKKKLTKKWPKKFLKIIRKCQGADRPKAENVLVIFLLAFCLFFGLAMFVSGERMRNEKEAIVPAPYIDPKLQKMVGGFPMENMLPYLSEKDKQVAAYLVAIAKKESNWGKFSPKKEGRECFNYWGYRGPENTTASGYSCFRNPQQAVAVVGSRVGELIAQKIDTPREMIVWKCGRNCEAAGGQAAAEKWIQDVDYYYGQLRRGDS